MTKTALILGASGRFGRNAAAEFKRAGWRVLQFDRKRDDLRTEARRADVIVNAWNPPNYATWARDLLPMHHTVIAAAKSAGATMIVPGNVYVFGQDTPGPWDARTPHNAFNPLGRLRVEMEAFYRASGVRTIVLRAGDFLDTEATGNWFDAVIAKKLHRGVLAYPGAIDAEHAWAYLPDLARAAVKLAEKRAQLPAFADVPFEGYTLTGRELRDAIAVVLSQDVTLKQMSWLPLQLLKPVWPMMRGLCEMRYLWNTPHRLDGSALKALLPDFEPTPLQDALPRIIAPMLADHAVAPKEARA